ncbi:hypothetical protein Pla163_15650 [Planctomycetes bacterium Pla163]|jgi:thioredoxin-related protein|uniref:Thioredoxin domain-containing protein n=1 Tax=Rohdeia mirabilis TaxID=2528008 RepID=A0A518CZ41_9BACT|nr:hypothetical protein Pla163_15650 [Planctomycetes bacterium Pla163]
MTESTHPHFDDGGAVVWQTDFHEALRAASQQGRLLFIEYGRKECTQCKALVLTVIPRPEIAAILSERYVCLAVDCDEAGDEVDELATKLEGAEMLPFVMVTDGRGQYLDGLSGRISPESLHRLLERLSSAANTKGA